MHKYAIILLLTLQRYEHNVNKTQKNYNKMIIK